MRDWATGTDGEWTSVGQHSDGSYGVPEGIIFSYPSVFENGEYKIVQGIEITEDAQERIDFTTKELLEERDAVQHLLK